MNKIHDNNSAKVEMGKWKYTMIRFLDYHLKVDCNKMYTTNANTNSKITEQKYIK